MKDIKSVEKTVKAMPDGKCDGCGHTSRFCTCGR